MNKIVKNKLLKVITKYKIMSISEQLSNKKGIMVIFKEYWSYNPTESEFGELASGLVVFPEMIYYMVKTNNNR